MLPLALYTARPSPGRASYNPSAAPWTDGTEANPKLPHRPPRDNGLGEGEILNGMPIGIPDNE